MHRSNGGAFVPVPGDESFVIRLPDAGLMHALDDVPDALDAILERGPRAVVVDMAGLSRLSSTTVAALLWIKRRCATRGTVLLLRSPSRECLTMLRRVGFVEASHLDAWNAWAVADGPLGPSIGGVQCGRSE